MKRHAISAIGLCPGHKALPRPGVLPRIILTLKNLGCWYIRCCSLYFAFRSGFRGVGYGGPGTKLLIFMPSYLYLAREAGTGREIRSSLDASTEQAAIAALLHKNLLVVT